MLPGRWALKTFSSVQFSCSVVSTLRDPMNHSTSLWWTGLLSITNSQSLKLIFIELVMLSNHLILCRRLLLLPSTFPSIRVISNELALCIRWPKYWSFSFSISPSNEQSGLISFRWIGWISLQSKGLLRIFSKITVQSITILQHSAFFIVQLSHPYMTTGKTIALTRRNFVGKVMSLLF